MILRSGLLTQKMTIRRILAYLTDMNSGHLCRSSGTQPTTHENRNTHRDGGGLQSSAVNPAHRDLVPPPQTSRSTHSRRGGKRCASAQSSEFCASNAVRGH